eukprot:204044-Chlamydomonas_euryale.AAC.1
MCVYVCVFVCVRIKAEYSLKDGAKLLEQAPGWWPLGLDTAFLTPSLLRFVIEHVQGHDGGARMKGWMDGGCVCVHACACVRVCVEGRGDGGRDLTRGCNLPRRGALVRIVCGRSARTEPMERAAGWRCMNRREEAPVSAVVGTRVG